MIGEKLGPYEILSAIGSGGMGEVWKARDTRLGRTVAIKKVKEQHSERFKQEARSIAALNHPNICQIHDIGDDYLVLEYVEGKPLSSPLPEREAVRLAIQIATALEAAHKKGIIHRDLKPANIMVTDEGTVKLLDFGLAKLYEQDTSISRLPTAEFPATEVGAILGTVAYMSPEQAQGQTADARSDIFSFGLVFYEMLSGRRAFIGDSTPETLAALLRDEPDPLRAFPALEKIVKRCLEKQPSERYQTMAEVKVVLEKVGQSKVAVSSEQPQPSIAVLPFVNMSGDKEQEYFSDGLAEEILNALTKIPGLKVIARTSAFAFKGKDQDITKIAEALRVSNILEGSVRKAGNRIRVTAQLITASDGSHIWSERYDRELTDIFAIQDEICRGIVDKLRIKLGAGHPIVKRYTENLEAYSLYLKGHYNIYKGTPDGMAKGRKYFEQALALDPKYAPAWFGLGDYYQNMGFLGYIPSDTAFGKAGEAARKALEN
jgi:serine/threonine protein kinase